MSIGNHVDKAKNYVAALKAAVNTALKNGCYMGAAQIFVTNPRSGKPTVSDVEAVEIKQYVAAANLNLYVHSSYLTNPWGEKPGLGKHLARLELGLADAVGARGLIVHLPRKTPAQIAESIAEILEGSTGVLYLEINSYTASDNTYETPEKINALLAVIRAKLPPADHKRIGVTVDTAHLWAAGVDVSTRHGAIEWCGRFDVIIGDHPVLVHLNDQIHQCGDGRDEHAPLTYGTIWSETKMDGGLGIILEWAVEHSHDAILERKSDKPKINNQPTGCNITADYLTLTYHHWYSL
jgi:deoxyribonuclease-4